MTEPGGEWERIAAALERLAPPIAQATDWTRDPAYLWNGETALSFSPLEALQLDRLRGIDEKKAAVCANIERLASGAAAHDMLLWGARGMGKSALIRASVAASQVDGRNIALVQISPDALSTFPALIAELRRVDRAFLIFIDDLGFGADDAQANLALRSMLDGGVVARPANIRLAVTSNRRAIVQRPSTNDANHFAGHERDDRDDALALADRFGLTLGFHPCDQETYLEIVHAYADPQRLDFDPKEANAWAIERGSRSGRTAYQYACELAGRAGVTL